MLQAIATYSQVNRFCLFAKIKNPPAYYTEGFFIFIYPNSLHSSHEFG